MCVCSAAAAADAGTVVEMVELMQLLEQVKVEGMASSVLLLVLLADKFFVAAAVVVLCKFKNVMPCLFGLEPPPPQLHLCPLRGAQRPGGRSDNDGLVVCVGQVDNVGRR